MFSALEKRLNALSSFWRIPSRVILEVQFLAISSKDIGNLVMKELANLDDVAYIRFASIYRQFKDVSGFMEAMEDMMAKHDKE